MDDNENILEDFVEGVANGEPTADGTGTGTRDEQVSHWLVIISMLWPILTDETVLFHWRHHDPRRTSLMCTHVPVFRLQAGRGLGEQHLKQLLKGVTRDCLQGASYLGEKVFSGISHLEECPSCTRVVIARYLESWLPVFLNWKHREGRVRTVWALRRRRDSYAMKDEPLSVTHDRHAAIQVDRLIRIIFPEYAQFAVRTPTPAGSFDELRRGLQDTDNLLRSELPSLPGLKGITQGNKDALGEVKSIIETSAGAGVHAGPAPGERNNLRELERLVQMADTLGKLVVSAIRNDLCSRGAQQ